MGTAVIQIGNSDDKLTQRQWHDFVRDTANVISENVAHVHFFATSEGSKPWQNACWVIESSRIDSLISFLGNVARKYRQDSIAVTVGETVFVPGP